MHAFLHYLSPLYRLLIHEIMYWCVCECVWKHAMYFTVDEYGALIITYAQVSLPLTHTLSLHSRSVFFTPSLGVLLFE